MENKLRTKIKQTIYVSHFDLQDFLSEKIGKSVEVIDSNNDTDYSISVKKEEIDDSDMDSVNTFLEKGYISMEYDYHAIFRYCANQGWIDEGDYVLEVSW